MGDDRLSEYAKSKFEGRHPLSKGKEVNPGLVLLDSIVYAATNIAKLFFGKK